MRHSTNQLRHILRRLWRARTFTGVTLLTLAIGIGANTAIFSVINGILLKPLPYPEAERLVAIWQTARGYITPLVIPPFITKEQLSVSFSAGG